MKRSSTGSSTGSSSSRRRRREEDEIQEMKRKKFDRIPEGGWDGRREEL